MNKPPCRNHTPAFKRKWRWPPSRAIERSPNWRSISMFTPIRLRHGKRNSKVGLPTFRARQHGAQHAAVDVKSLHAKIGEPTLENDFERRAQQSRAAECKAMIDREHDLPITKQAEF